MACLCCETAFCLADEAGCEFLCGGRWC
jgi:hypothetical protein